MSSQQKLSTDNQKEAEQLFDRFQEMCEERGMKVERDKDNPDFFTFTDDQYYTTKHHLSVLVEIIKKSKLTVTTPV